MSKQSTSILNLTNEINKALQQRGKELENEFMNCLDNAKDFALENIKNTAPRDNRNVEVHLADSFVAEKNNSGARTFYKIYSEKHAPLVHLVELGFTHYKTKQFVQGQPFMIPTLNVTSEKFVKDLYKATKK